MLDAAHHVMHDSCCSHRSHLSQHQRLIGSTSEPFNVSLILNLDLVQNLILSQQRWQWQCRMSIPGMRTKARARTEKLARVPR